MENQPAQLKNSTDPVLVTDPVQAARVAGLRYVSDLKPGIRRKKVGKHFSYVSPDGSKIRDPDELKRINALAIPPAYTDVWICPNPNGHIQATGRDARGRKQYRYHARWRQIRDETKYGRMVAFGDVLPQLRCRVEEDLALPGLPRNKILAAITRLLETTLIRVGSDEYARTNHSFGLTTLENRHVDVAGSRVQFRFRGKSNVIHVIDLKDRRLARIIKKCQDLPGYELFEYLGDDGQYHSVDSVDVNDYLREITGHEFTAKDFRTWHGTVLGFAALCKLGPCDTESTIRHNIAQAIEAVSKKLGNTPAVCRKCYVHPFVLESYRDGSLLNRSLPASGPITDSIPPGLHPEERAVLDFLRQKLSEPVKAE